MQLEQWQVVQAQQQNGQGLGASAFTPASYHSMGGAPNVGFPFSPPFNPPPSSARHHSATPASHLFPGGRQISPCTSTSSSSSSCYSAYSSPSSCSPPCGPSDLLPTANNDSYRPPHIPFLGVGARERWEEGVDDVGGRRNEGRGEEEGQESLSRRAELVRGHAGRGAGAGGGWGGGGRGGRGMGAGGAGRRVGATGRGGERGGGSAENVSAAPPSYFPRQAHEWHI